MQRNVNLVDLVKSVPTNIFLQNLASIQQRTSPLKFAHLAEKSEKVSISNLSTKAGRAELDLVQHDGLGAPAGGAPFGLDLVAVSAATCRADRGREARRSACQALCLL